MDATGGLTRQLFRCNKLAVIAKLTNNYVKDIGFDAEGYLTAHLAKSFGRAEDDAFINGSGEGMPTGILHGTDGAEIGVITTEIKFDDMAELCLHRIASQNPQNTGQSSAGMFVQFMVRDSLAITAHPI